MGDDRLDMTVDQWEIFRRLTEGFPEDRPERVDTARLRQNLRLSPLDRLRRLQREILSLRRLKARA